MKRVLFVDDEPRVLDGLRRMLRPLRTEWETHFAPSAEAALVELSRTEFDVIVSDTSMPGRDGGSLLSEVKERFPRVVRIILSGHADREMVLRTIGPAHQYLAKPCDAETLKEAVTRASALRNLLSSEPLTQLLSRIETLPSLPRSYAQLEEELLSEDASTQVVGRIISKDLGMTAQILKLVNSAFFGLPRHISSPLQAVNLLGLETIRALFLTAQVFSQFEGHRLPGADLETISHHSQGVGVMSRAIASVHKCGKKETEEALISGLLHDVGKLVLAANLPRQYAQAMALAPLREIPIWQAELDVLGASHAGVGAYLLGLWGFSDQILEAVAFHHNPAECRHQGFGTLTSVHVADALFYEDRPLEDGVVKPRVDEAYAESLGLSESLPLWRDRCHEILAKGEGDD